MTCHPPRVGYTAIRKTNVLSSPSWEQCKDILGTDLVVSKITYNEVWFEGFLKPLAADKFHYFFKDVNLEDYL